MLLPQHNKTREDGETKNNRTMKPDLDKTKNSSRTIDHPRTNHFSKFCSRCRETSRQLVQTLCRPDTWHTYISSEHMKKMRPNVCVPPVLVCAHEHKPLLLGSRVGSTGEARALPRKQPNRLKSLQQKEKRKKKKHAKFLVLDMIVLKAQHTWRGSRLGSAHFFI